MTWRIRNLYWRVVYAFRPGSRSRMVIWWWAQRLRGNVIRINRR